VSDGAGTGLSATKTIERGKTMSEEKALVPLKEMSQMANILADSGMFSVRDPQQMLGLMLLCRSKGLDPVQAAERYHVIQGRPAMKAETMLAEFQVRGGKVKWLQHTPTVVEGQFSHPSGGTLTVKWTIQMAKDAGLAGKNPWRQFPENMLHARVVSNGVRWTCPEAVLGVYTPEEVHDFDTSPPRAKAKTKPIEGEPVEPPPTPKLATPVLKPPEKTTEPETVDAEIVDGTPLTEPPPETEPEPPTKRPRTVYVTPNQRKKLFAIFGCEEGTADGDALHVALKERWQYDSIQQTLTKEQASTWIDELEAPPPDPPPATEDDVADAEKRAKAFDLIGELKEQLGDGAFFEIVNPLIGKNSRIIDQPLENLRVIFKALDKAFKKGGTGE